MSLRSPYPDVQIPDVSLTEFLFADGFGDRADAPAIVDGTTGDQLTYTEFHGLVEKIAGGLAARGIGTGDVVALFAPNLPQWAALFHGILRANAIVTSANSLYSPGELAHQLRDSGAKLLFTVSPFLDRAAAAVAEAGLPADSIIVLDAAGVASGTNKVESFNVVELVKGESGLGGTFSVAYEGHYSRDIAFDASAAAVKTRLQEIASVDEVNVAKEVLGNSIKYTVTFTKQLGNLREMQASPYVYEEQTVTTTGGDPTPLDGTFALTFYNETTAPIPYDAPASAVKAALEALPTLDRVDVAKAERNYGQADWMVTFRSELGDLELLGCDATLLTGSDAACASSEIVAGDAASLTGSTPRVRVEEKVAGLPSYTGSYTPAATGDADVVVRQLVQGGLAAEYFDNAWLQGDPTVVRVDPKIDFDWGHGAVTPYGRDYVSARWSGKVVPPSTDVYTLYVFFDDGARVSHLTNLQVEVSLVR